MAPDFALRELNSTGDTAGRGGISRFVSLSARLAGGSSDRAMGSAFTATESKAAITARKGCRTAPPCPSTVLLTAALFFLAAATASALPGGSGGTKLPSSRAAAAGEGVGRRTLWVASSRTSGDCDVDGSIGGSIYETGGGCLVSGCGARTRHRREQLQELASQPILVPPGGFRGWRRREVGAAEALQVRGGGRPWFTGYEETTDGEGSSSEEG